MNLPAALHLDAPRASGRIPQYYFRDIPAYMMEDIIIGMIDGKPEPTPEEMEAWLTEELEQEAEALLVANG